MSLASCSWRETTEIEIGEYTDGVGDSSQVLKVWEIAQKLMHRLTARGLLLGAIAVALILCGCKRQNWFWEF